MTNGPRPARAPPGRRPAYRRSLYPHRPSGEPRPRPAAVRHRHMLAAGDRGARLGLASGPRDTATKSGASAPSSFVPFLLHLAGQPRTGEPPDAHGGARRDVQRCRALRDVILGDCMPPWAPARWQVLTPRSAFTYTGPRRAVKERSDGQDRTSRRHWRNPLVEWRGVLEATPPNFSQVRHEVTAAKPLPEPIKTAITLLGWSGDDVPPIQLVEGRPPDGAATAQGWVRYNDDGSAMPVVYVRTDTEVYQDAARQNYQALVRLAGVLAHERWHLRHGPDDVGAYTAQLLTMEYLHANTMNLAEVRRALRLVIEMRKK